MADHNFRDNLLRMIAAELHFQSALHASREMFGRSYFSLGLAEKTAVDQAIFGSIAGNYQAITPDLLAAQQERPPMGFPVHTPPPTQGSSKP